MMSSSFFARGLRLGRSCIVTNRNGVAHNYPLRPFSAKGGSSTVISASSKDSNDESDRVSKKLLRRSLLTSIRSRLAATAPEQATTGKEVVAPLSSVSSSSYSPAVSTSFPSSSSSEISSSSSSSSEVSSSSKISQKAMTESMERIMVEPTQVQNFSEDVEADGSASLETKVMTPLRTRGKSVLEIPSRSNPLPSTRPVPSVEKVVDEIVPEVSDEEVAFSEFSKLGLIHNIVKGLTAQTFTEPTPVQRAVIPRLLNGEDLVMAASTGSGKTLAFILPVIQALLTQESLGYRRQAQRPRCLILVPTRELARQILVAIKSISHFAKTSSAAVLGGEAYAQQKEALSRLVDIVVASPGRLMQHKEKGNVFFSQVTHIVIDEVDTMLTQGFGPDIRAILRAGLNKHSAPELGSNSSSIPSSASVSSLSPPPPAQVIMATATLTKAVKQLLSDVNGNFNIEFSDASNKTPKKLNGTETSVSISVVEVDGVHRTLPHVQHLVEDTKVIIYFIVSYKTP